MIVPLGVVTHAFGNALQILCIPSFILPFGGSPPRRPSWTLMPVTRYRL